MANTKSKRTAYIRNNKEEINENTQKNLISRHEIHEYIYEDVIDDPESKKELFKLIERVGSGDTVVVSECGVISLVAQEFLAIHESIAQKGAILFCVKEGCYTGSKKMNGLIESIKNTITIEHEMFSYRVAESEYVPPKKPVVQYLMEKVPSNPKKTRVIIKDEESTSILQMVADKKLTKREAAKKLKVSVSTIDKVYKDKVASGEIVIKSLSDIKIAKTKAIMPKNWSRLYSGYKNGTSSVSDISKACGLKKSEISTLIKYQEAGLLA